MAIFSAEPAVDPCCRDHRSRRRHNQGLWYVKPKKDSRASDFLFMSSSKATRRQVSSSNTVEDIGVD
jgi:hypothetical protein